MQHLDFATLRVVALHRLRTVAARNPMPKHALQLRNVNPALAGCAEAVGKPPVLHRAVQGRAVLADDARRFVQPHQCHDASPIAALRCRNALRATGRAGGDARLFRSYGNLAYWCNATTAMP